MACVAVTLHSPWYPVEIIDKVTLFNNKIASNMSLSVCLCSKMTKRAPASRAVLYHGVVGVCTVRHGLHRSILGVYRLGQRIWPAMSRNRLEISLESYFWHRSPIARTVNSHTRQQAPLSGLVVTAPARRRPGFGLSIYHESRAKRVRSKLILSRC